MKRLMTFLVFLVLLTTTAPVMAVEVAPRISDREIVERLTRVEEGIKALRSNMDARFDGVNARFDSINARFDLLTWMIGLFVTIASILIGFLFRMQLQMNQRQIKMETSLETQRDEIAWLKEMINKLLPSKGVL